MAGKVCHFRYAQPWYGSGPALPRHAGGDENPLNGARLRVKQDWYGRPAVARFGGGRSLATRCARSAPYLKEATRAALYLVGLAPGADSAGAGKVQHALDWDYRPLANGGSDVDLLITGSQHLLQVL